MKSVLTVPGSNFKLSLLRQANINLTDKTEGTRMVVNALSLPFRVV